MVKTKVAYSDLRRYPMLAEYVMNHPEQFEIDYDA